MAHFADKFYVDKQKIDRGGNPPVCPVLFGPCAAALGAAVHDIGPAFSVW